MSKNKQISAEDVEAALDMLLEILNHQEEESQTWDDHEKSVNEANKPDDRVALGTTTLVDKLGMILHDISNNILIGRTLVESGDEALALTKAVVLREQLREAVKAK